MNLRRLGTRFMALFARSHVCADGPMAGAGLTLTENSRSTAYIVVRGEIGRYVVDEDGRLVWERAPCA